MRTHYSVEFKLRVLTALDVNDGNIYKTAHQFGIGRSNVSEWNRDREKIFAQGEMLLQQKRLHLAQRMELIVNQIIDAMPKKIERARLGDSAHALRLLIDLSTQVEAKQTAQTATREQVYAKLFRLLNGYAEREGGEFQTAWREQFADGDGTDQD